MDRPYDDIPRTGGPHRKQIDREHSGLNVRAPRVTDEQGRKTPERTFQLSFNEERRSYRVHVWNDEVGACESGYTEVSRFKNSDELAASLAEASSSMGYVVLENSETGEVFMDQEVNLRDDWTHDGRFDRVTTFADEEAAVAYTDSRQAG